MTSKAEQIAELRAAVKLARGKWEELEAVQESLRTELPKAVAHYQSLSDKLVRLERGNGTQHRREKYIESLQRQLAAIQQEA